MFQHFREDDAAKNLLVEENTKLSERLQTTEIKQFELQEQLEKEKAGFLKFDKELREQKIKLEQALIEQEEFEIILKSMHIPPLRKQEDSVLTVYLAKKGVQAGSILFSAVVVDIPDRIAWLPVIERTRALEQRLTYMNLIDP